MKKMVYQFLRKNIKLINSILITVFVSLFFNTLSSIEGSIFEKDLSSIVEQVLSLNTISGFITVISVALLFIINTSIKLTEKVRNRFDISKNFYEIMLSKTDERIRESVEYGHFSWGENKSVEMSNKILYGWSQEQIKVIKYEDEIFDFKSLPKSEMQVGDFDKNKYKDFIGSDLFRKMEEEGGNLPKYMLTGCKCNFKKNNELQLYLRKSDWGQCQYIWQSFKNNTTLMKRYAQGIKSGLNSDYHLPNSFCLHLIVETADDKIVKSRISKTKYNDYPGTWAVTLGEQIEAFDFSDGKSFYYDFVTRWAKRALDEEYGIPNGKFDEMISPNSLRVLSVDFEGDIYNFSLLCIIKLSITSNELIKYEEDNLDSNEATELGFIEFKEIPSILMDYPGNKNEYHPSSYIRLMFTYMHRYGIDQFERKIIRIQKEKDL